MTPPACWSSCPGLLPASTSCLAWLRSLHLGQSDWDVHHGAAEAEGSNSEGATAALWRLHGLAALALCGIGYASSDALLAPALDSLTALCRLCVCTLYSGLDRRELAPGGLAAWHAWLRRVTWLGISWQVLLATPQLLKAAPALASLWVMGSCARGKQHSALANTLPHWIHYLLGACCAALYALRLQNGRSVLLNRSREGRSGEQQGGQQAARSRGPERSRSSSGGASRKGTEKKIQCPDAARSRCR